MGDETPPCYTSIRPEERYCRVTEAIYTALDMAYDALEERILLRSLRSDIADAKKEPTSAEAEALAKFEQVFKTIYFDKDQVRSELKSPLNRGLNHAVETLLSGLPMYGAVD